MSKNLLTLLLTCLPIFFGCTGGSHGTYPDAPFTPVTSDFAEVIALTEEPPESDTEANDAYWEKRWAVHDNSMEETILKNAPQAEKDLFDACWTGNYVTARKLADKILKEDPLSIVGLFGIAQVEMYAEGDLPYALNAIRQARKQAEAMGRENPSDPNGQEWYLRTLETEYYILFAMDRSEDVLRVVDLMEQVYDESMPWLKAWPLMELKREVEVREVIAECIRKEQFQTEALNTLGAFEDRLHRPQKFLSLYRDLAENNPNGSLIWYNLGFAEVYSGEHGKAEEAFLKSTKTTDLPFHGTAYTPLSVLYLQQGRILEAFDALKHAQTQRGDREAYTLQQDEAEVNRAIAGLMLAMGEEKQALRFSLAAKNAPDRAGSNNSAEQDWEITNGLAYWSVLKCCTEKLQEEGSLRRLTVKERSELLGHKASQWRTKQELRQWMDGEQVVFLMRPNLPGTAGFNTGLQSWQRFGMLDTLPLGVLAQGLKEAKLAEADNPAAKPYLDAFESGILLRQRRYNDAYKLAKLSLAQLNPKTEKVFRAHLSALAGQAAWKTGKPAEALSHWSATLRDFPQAFRMLDIRLPLAISHDESPVTKQVAKNLNGSTRFFSDKDGYSTRITQHDGNVWIELFEQGQTRQLELEIVMDAEGGPADLRAAIDFHDKLFKPTVELTQADLGSLDGSPIAARLGRQVDDLFSDLTLSKK